MVTKLKGPQRYGTSTATAIQVYNNKMSMKTIVHLIIYIK